MSRPWNITEQVIVEPTTKLRFEFTSEHSKAVAAGEPPPYHDKAIVLNLYNESGTRVIRMDFTRGGEFVGATVDAVEPDAPPPLTEQEEISKAMMEQAPAETGAIEELDLPRKTAEQHAAEIKAAWEGETTQEQAWEGINLAKGFTADIE